MVGLDLGFYVLFFSISVTRTMGVRIMIGCEQKNPIYD